MLPFLFICEIGSAKIETLVDYCLVLYSYSMLFLFFVINMRLISAYFVIFEPNIFYRYG
nr:MAG TPA: hypothetical protein [Caudoviricetes sp.]